MLNLILNLVPINMKKTRIEITHQIEKTKYVFYVIDQGKLTISEVLRIKIAMGVETVFISGRLYK